jgi:signal transduction histidine kinase
MAKIRKKIRLIRKTSRGFLAISFVLITISTVALFFYVHNLLEKEVEEELRSLENRIESAIASDNVLYQLPPMVEVGRVPEPGRERLRDTLIFDPSQGEMEEFRELTTFPVIKGQNYRITVRVLVVESEDILVAVVISYLIITLLVFIFLFYLNRSGNQKIWQPFFKNLEKIKGFSISSEKPIALLDSDVLEFSELNDEVAALTSKVRSDYKNLKQYTEDVSHEMKSPLAIIQAKIENLINGEHLNDTQFEHLTSIQKDIQRLTQLQKRLSLLTKIENQQFSNTESIDFNQLAQERIENFREIYSSSIDLVEEGTLKLQMDPYLADVLIDNLISNAIKHSTTRGTITILIRDYAFSVSNEGADALQDSHKLFSRFYRGTGEKKSTGLGLAIAKKICDLYGFVPGYEFREGRHVFTIRIDPNFPSTQNRAVAVRT